MNRFAKYTLIGTALNIIAILSIFFLIGDRSLDAVLLNLVIIAVFIIIEIIASLFLLANAEAKIYGQAMLLSLGIILLIGFSWCGLIAMN